MKREDKGKIIETLAAQIKESSHFYVADIAGLDAAQTTELRRECFRNNIKLVVAKNTLFQKAIEKSGKDIQGFEKILAGPTSVMFTEVSNAPAKLIKEFRRRGEKPILKGAFVEDDVYVGDDQLDSLVAVKSKSELIADVMAMLQTPIRNVIGALQSGGNTITGVLKTLEEKKS
jgi:large subunit ribosomal protein L10